MCLKSHLGRTNPRAAMEDIDLEHPSIQRALCRYPDVDASRLHFPSDALEWSEKELDLFVGSGGFLKPKRRKPPTSPRVPRVPQTEAAGSSGYDVPLSKTAVTTPGYAAVPEQALTAWHDNSFWAPYATYMEDVGEKGLRLHAALNKCERFRNVGLKKGAGMTLNSLKEKFKAGILLREFALEMTAQPPSEILSLLWVSLRLELPCAPFMPMYQLLVPDGSNEPVCKGIFGMLMLDTETMSVLEDQKVYEKVATPLREVFRIRKPTGNEGVPKFPRIYPPRGTPFTPTQLYCTTYTIMPSDCAEDAVPGEALLSLMRALPTPQGDVDEERYPLGRDLITYQSPRQKRARLEASLELQDEAKATNVGFQSPKGRRHRAPKALQSSPKVKGDHEPNKDGSLMGFDVTKVLAKMADRSVLLAKNREGEQVALKVLEKHSMWLTPKRKIGFEAEVMQQLKHPGIVNLLQVIEEDERLCLVMEYVPGGDMLQDIIRQGRFLEPHAKRLVRQLGDAMTYVHSRNVVHRDLKPENILLTSNDRETMSVKLELSQRFISDFGISRLTSSSQDCQTYLGSRDYRAPEVVRLGINRKRPSGDQGGYGKPADMWSLGVVVYVMLSGERAFESESKVEVEILKGLWRFAAEVWGAISQDAKDLVKALMQQEPKKRLRACEVLEHPWLIVAANSPGKNWRRSMHLDSGDMYRVIFHPQMVSVCDKVNYKVDLPFTKEPAVAIYANLAKPAGVDECFDVRIFIDPASATCRQHRVLYLFSANNSGHMAVFMVYGATPGLLYSEEISCCGAKKFPALETFAMRGIIGNNVDHSLNLKRCVNRTKT
eukprot:s1142_g8.t1